MSWNEYKDLKTKGKVKLKKNADDEIFMESTWETKLNVANLQREKDNLLETIAKIDELLADIGAL